jgi:hypothetical protein
LEKETKSRGPRSTVFLVSYSADNKVIERIEISYDDYYAGMTPVVDDDAFRKMHGVRRLTGEIYNSQGQRQQSFDNTYDERGAYVRSRIVSADGTIIED